MKTDTVDQATENANDNNNNVAPPEFEHLVFLDPADIQIDTHTQVRPYSQRSGDSEADNAAMQELMESIKSIGQLQPVRVRVDSEGKYHLTAGARRVRAIFLLNMEGKKQYQVKAVVIPQQDEKTATREALAENIHRKDMSAMDKAAMIQRVRTDNGWDGGKNTKHVAKYFGVSPAQITQYEKLLAMPNEIQVRVHSGEISASAALELVSVAPDKREEVIQQAAQEQQTEETKAAEKKKSGKGGGAKGKAGARKTGQVQAKHVRTAARKVEGATDPNKVKSLSKSEILAFFEDIRDAVPSLYGYPDGEVKTFVTYFLDKFCMGKGTSATATKHFDNMVAKAARGTKESMPVEPAKAETKKPEAKATKKKAGKKASTKK